MEPVTPTRRYTKAELAAALTIDAFPRSASYDPDWMLENLMGPNALWLTEALSQVMTLEPGMRVLDMGCGRAMSSIFLAKEFGLQVWATDLWIGASDNWQRVCAAGLQWLEVAGAQGFRSDAGEAAMLRVDAGRTLGFTRMVARRR